MRTLVLAAVTALISSTAFAQAQTTSFAQSPRIDEADAGLATPAGHEINVSFGHYNYAEPGAPGITIHGPKLGAEYTGTFLLNPRTHWFAQGDVRGTTGNVTYDGACAPWVIVPNSLSPNGYALDVGDYDPCSESGDADWYVEGRALVGKDMIGRTWAWSPMIGVGLRALSNGTTGISGYRTERYLYVPIGLTARTRIASQRVLNVNVEYDRLIRGWNTTRDSELGSGIVKATPIAPSFSIDSFTDLSFTQHEGWAVRASAELQMSRHWSVTPYLVHWRVQASPVSDETVAYTVLGVTAHEVLGAYEPFNKTTEFGVKLGVRF